MSQIAMLLISRFANFWMGSEVYCPVCGYHCLGRGGMECIDKPMIERLDDE